MKKVVVAAENRLVFKLSEYIDNWLREINYRFRTNCTLVADDSIVILLPNDNKLVLFRKNDDYFQISLINNGQVIDKCFSDSYHAQEIWDYVQPSPSERKRILEEIDKLLEDPYNG